MTFQSCLDPGYNDSDFSTDNAKHKVINDIRVQCTCTLLRPGAKSSWPFKAIDSLYSSSPHVNKKLEKTFF